MVEPTTPKGMASNLPPRPPQDAAPAMPPCLPGLCTSVTRDTGNATIYKTDIVESIRNSIQDMLKSEFQQFNAQFNDRLDSFSRNQDSFAEQMKMTNETVRSMIDAQQQLMVKEEKEEKAVLSAAMEAFNRDTRDNAAAAQPTRLSNSKKRRASSAPPADGSLDLGSIVKCVSEGTLAQGHSQANIELIHMVTCHAGEATREEPFSFVKWLQGWPRKNKEAKVNDIDLVMGLLIVVNAITIGFSMDNEDSTFLEVVDYFFTIAFIIELLTKIALLGFRGQYCGPGAKMNIFDSSLVVIDLAQLLMKKAFYDEIGSKVKDTPSASMFRVIRLVRLVRLLRVLRMPIFQDLISMITGMTGGLATLGWSIALFALIVYVVALLFREFFGRKDWQYVKPYFATVPRSMFTVFRCSFGDCSTDGGMPIFEHVDIHYGTFYTIMYCLFVFVISIGLFNVISAIFVESTMKAAADLELSRKKERMQDRDLWETRVAKMMVVMLEQSGKAFEDKEIKETMKTFTLEKINPEMFKQWVNDVRVKRCLDDLDINPDDHNYLFDILDSDNTGEMFPSELTDGISRLRGEPRRSDTITIDLMVRSIQHQVDELVREMKFLMVHFGLLPELPVN